MRTRCFVLLLLTSFAVAQTKTPAAQKPATPQTAAPDAEKQRTAPSGGPGIQKAEPAENAVPADAAVITIDGVCDKPAASPTDCKTVITRAQFEQVLSMVAPSRAGSPTQFPPAVKRNMATQYSQLLSVAGAAEKEGVENTPQAQELLRFARLQALAQAYTRQLQQKLEPTDAEIQTFYTANADKLEQATLERLFVPKPSEAAKPASSKAKPAGAAAKIAAGADNFAATTQKFRQRIMAGEAFDKLQKEALVGSNFPNPPETRMVAQKGTLPPSQEAVFNLKAGEVSQVFNEPSGAYIYKMVSKGAVPLEQVRDEIKQRLTQEKMQAAMDSVLKSSKPVLNDEYFGPAPAAQVAPGAPRPVPGTPVPSAKPQGGTEKPKPDSQPK
jgi:hypothetical protein